jgi:hypothetical protein
MAKSLVMMMAADSCITILWTSWAVLELFAAAM